MFERRSLSADVEAVRETHAPDAIVLDAGHDFETLDPARAEQLGLVVDALDPATYPAEWVPPDAPDLLHRYASEEFTVGLPGDGSVAWTRQTSPPVVIVKPRVAGSPESFVGFLVAEALVEVGSDLPESFLPFFGEEYPAFWATADLDPGGRYQLSAAVFDAWVGLHTREVFESWSDRPLADAWVDAGERLTGRLADLPGALARDELSFGEAAELACSAIKHGLDVPAPFGALDTLAYRERGAPFAVAWAEKTFERLS